MRVRRGKALCAAVGCVFLASCVVHGPAVVTTAEQAIRLGQKACFPDGWKPQAGQVWQAKHRQWRDDVWQVRLANENDLDNPNGPKVEVWADGQVEACVETVRSMGNSGAAPMP